MFEYTKEDLNIIANEMNFTRDTLEKVIRLVKILDFINSDSELSGKLFLKGGTAINLFIFELARLSVDIDLDFNGNCSRDEMIIQREIITSKLNNYFEMEDYNLNPKSKSRHSLDSFVVNYLNAGGMNDNIKIEINYSLRSHLFEPDYKNIAIKGIESKNKIAILNKFELFAAKLNALLSRAMPRDLYDVNNLVSYKIFSKDEMELLRNVFVFYTVLSQEVIPNEYSLEPLDYITLKTALAALLPVLHKGTHIDLNSYKKNIEPFLSDLINLNKEQKEFLNLFNQKIYKPELLFSDKNILSRIINHPMIMWKISDKSDVPVKISTI